VLFYGLVRVIVISYTEGTGLFSFLFFWSSLPLLRGNYGFCIYDWVYRDTNQVARQSWTHYRKWNLGTTRVLESWIIQV